MSAPKVALPPQVQAALARGDKIEAIKLLRNSSGLGLKEALHAVEAAMAAGPDPLAVGRGSPSRSLSPGEVPRAPTGQVWLVVLIALLAAAGAYWWWR